MLNKLTVIVTYISGKNKICDLGGRGGVIQFPFDICTYHYNTKASAQEED